VPAPALPIPEVADARALGLDARLDRDAVLRDGDGLRYLVVTVTAPEAPWERVPVDLALVVDTSGSMGQDGKLAQAQAAADSLVDALRPGDHFALVSFDDRARLLTAGAFDGDTERLHALVGGLRDDGGTNLWDGIATGRRALRDAGPTVRKVLVVSDGHANVGETEPDAFTDLARLYGQDGVSVSAIGLGRDFNETLLEGMADAGGGTYRFVGEPEELPSVIAAELQRTTETFARRVTVRVRAAEGVTIHDVYGWPAERSDGGVEVDIGDIAAGQTRKIVLAVDVPADDRGEQTVAAAELTWESLDGAYGQVWDRAAARVTDDPADVEASVDEAASVAASRARAGDLARASADAWRRGDALRARSMVQSAAFIVAEARRSSDAPELRMDAARLVEIEAL
ncbi:MAG: vWA domain-containing protein, partial [Myxococcota bacterium]